MKRKFILGEEWLYYKIYCGKRTADVILTQVIKPLAENLIKTKDITQWFFIRYTDPKPHLRIRFHMAAISKIATVIETVKNALYQGIENNTIWSVQADTYIRELERYGYTTMETSEKLFFLDSNVCVNVLNLIEDDTLLFLFSLRYINHLLSAFDFTIDEKIRFSKYHFDAFKKEFNADKHLNKQLNIKYTTLKEDITSFMLKPNKEYQTLLNIISENKQQLYPLTEQLTTKLNNENITKENLLSSYIHMTVNRLFRDQQRLHELVCYSSLYRFYQFCRSTHEQV